jgi:hypothetical protein
MRLSEASLVIRPRPRWEAIDAGVLLAGQHRRLATLAWAATSLPIFALISALLWQSPSLAFLLFWWLKPAFERLSLLIFSQALFTEPPGLQQALKQWPGLLKPQLLASLTTRRLSLSRSYHLPVQQLEGLRGPERQRRLATLGGPDASAARWLTLVGMHLEMALWLGLMALFYLLLPAQVAQELGWRQLLAGTQSEWLWLEHLSNLFYALVLVLWGPIYVACGFSLYLNRRTTLEAWDIERVLRGLRQRLGGLAAVVLSLVAMLALPMPDAMANADPTTPRLLEQPLNSQAAQQGIQHIVEQPPFRNLDTVTRLTLGKDAAQRPAHSALRDWFQWLDGRSLQHIARALEVLLWSLLIAGVALLLWRYRDGLRTFIGRRPAARAKQSPVPAQLFGLELSPQSLPDDIAGHAEQLWATDPRQALGLLYRGLLSRLLEQHHLPLKQADTEGQVLEQVLRLHQPPLSDYSLQLTQHWQALAYGHRLPSVGAWQQLCDGWRALFDPAVRR